MEAEGGERWDEVYIGSQPAAESGRRCASERLPMHLGHAMPWVPDGAVASPSAPFGFLNPKRVLIRLDPIAKPCGLVGHDVM